MAMLLATSPPGEIPTAPHHHRLLHILTQSTAVSLPHLKQIHAKILRTAPPPYLSAETVYLYSRLMHFSALQDTLYAQRLFDQIPYPNTFVYNTVIRAYAHSKDSKERAFSVFQELLEQESLLPDKHTFPFVLKACAYLFDLREGKQAHAHFLKRGFGSDVYGSNSLIHFYASCGLLDDARTVFDKMPERSLVSWNAIIDALVQVGEFDEALRMFVEMMPSFKPDGYTVQSAIDACAGLGALYMGMWLHAYVLRNCEMDMDAKFDVLVKNSLIEMYYKCGSMRMALQVFHGMCRRDVNSWNAVIFGLAMHGEAETVFELLDRMIHEDKLHPNSITFVAVLSACNHRGLVEEGRRYFDKMASEFNVEPVLQHYGCLVDLLARKGHIDEALEIVSSMPIKPDDVIWRSLLDASWKQGEGLELSQEMAKHLMEEDEGSSTSGAYVLLSRVFASANRWNEVGLIRKLMTDMGVAKEPGCSSVEIDGIVHEFFAGDTTHPQTKDVYNLLDLIEEKVKMAGYVHDHSQAPLVDEARDGKGSSLRLHSERLAIAFALLNSKPDSPPIRVFKNLRVCNDCHNFVKLISKVMNVEIIMRDRLRFHCFKNGSCSCMDFW